MPERPAAPTERPPLTRRDFLTRGLGRRAAAVLGAGAAGVAAAPAGAADPVVLAPGALRRQSRAEVRAALTRIRVRRRAP